MSVRAVGRAVIALFGFAILGATPLEASSGGTGAPDESSAAAQRLVKEYRDALLSTVALRIGGPKRGEVTAEYAVAEICRFVGVPYQVQRSRTLTQGKTATLVAAPMYFRAAADFALRVVCEGAGLEFRLDSQGVYLVVPGQPAADEPGPGATAEEQGSGQTPPSRPLSDLQRAQIGAAINVTAKAQFKTDTDKDKEVAGRLRRDGVENETRTERTRQQVQLEISIVSTQAIGDVRVKVTFLGLRHTLRAEDARSRRAPSYEETRTRIVLLEQDLPVGDLRPLGRRAGRSGVATADYTDISYEMTWLETSLTSDRQTKERDKSGPFRTGTQYRGWILDVYAGGHLVKVVASSRGLFEELGRDPATGFPR